MSEFDAANKFYEESKFAEAIAAYQQLVNANSAAPAVYYNLANAYFRKGEKGRAIVNYLRAERLAPRDTEIRLNLQFVRDTVGIGDATSASPWQRILSWLTAGELTAVATMSYWLCFGLLGLGQLRPSLRPRLWLPSWAAAACCVAALGWLVAASRGELSAGHGVVVAPEAVVRLGPLEESQSSHSLHDGVEITILERRQDWLRVRDSKNRIGWIRSAQITTS